jgi:hypothetical protein
MGHKKERLMNSRSSKYPVIVSSRKGYDEPSELKRVEELLDLKHRAEAAEERCSPSAPEKRRLHEKTGNERFIVWDKSSKASV